MILMKDISLFGYRHFITRKQVYAVRIIKEQIINKQRNYSEYS